MVTNFREQGYKFVIANQSVAAFSLIFVVAFALIASNAAFNQPGKHPRPIWNGSKKLVTNAVPSRKNFAIPARKVKTVKFPPVNNSLANIPVPSPRPQQKTHRQTSIKNLLKSATFDAKRVDIDKVQNRLQRLGFYDGPVDGLIGTQTVHAIKKFESSKFLPESGEISPALILLLESAVGRASRDVSKTNTTEFNSKNNNQIRGMISRYNNIDPKMITRIQVGLINYGNRHISIDGLLGNQTRHAIKDFQKRFNIEVTGIPSMALIKKLESVGALTSG